MGEGGTQMHTKKNYTKVFQAYQMGFINFIAYQMGFINFINRLKVKNLAMSVIKSFLYSH